MVYGDEDAKRREFLEQYQRDYPEKYARHLAKIQKDIETEKALKNREYSTTLLDHHISAYRAWFLADTVEGLRLMSYSDTIWRPYQELEAYCQHNATHIPPTFNCCGLYALKSPNNIHGTIIGEVALWGRFIEGTQGFQAQFAYPQRFLYISCTTCNSIKSVSKAAAFPFPQTFQSSLEYRFICEGCIKGISTSFTPMPASIIIDRLNLEYGLERTESIEDVLNNLDLEGL